MPEAAASAASVSDPADSADSACAPRRFGLIGCGAIAVPVIDCWRTGGLPGWTLSAVLARRRRLHGDVPVTDDADAFFAAGHSLIVDAAGPAALAALGVRALAVADVWTVGAAALADDALLAALEAAGRAAGHRLRVLAGAFAGLDGVAMTAVDPRAVLQLDIDLPPSPGPRRQVWRGSVREAARQHPDSVNVAVAAALAGPGLDATRIELHAPGPVPAHRLALRARSAHADVEAAVSPHADAGLHPVAACVIAALRREVRTVWVG